MQAVTMQDYSIAKCSRRCAISDRPLEPGEPFVSVIKPDSDGVRRLDIAASQWQGPDDDTIGWWQCRMPERSAEKLRPAPNGVLLDTLTSLLETPGSEALAYLLAVLLVRRRVLSEEQAVTSEANPGIWTLVCKGDDRRWLIPFRDDVPDADQTLTDELQQLLFTSE